MVKEKTMENHITCPSCNETLSDNPLIDDAANKVGLAPERSPVFVVSG
jgi:hypothetical protein